jgi:hypothetical protein
MTHRLTRLARLHFSLLLIILLGPTAVLAQTKKPLQFSDLMAFREIRHLRANPSATWLTLTAKPDLGISDVLAIRSQDGQTVTLPGHEESTLSKTGDWLIAFQAKDPNRHPDPDEPKAEGRTLTLLSVPSGSRKAFKQVSAASFDAEGKWLFIRCYAENDGDDTQEKAKPVEPDREKKSPALLIHLETGRQVEYPNIAAAAMDPHAPRLALVSDGQLSLLDLTLTDPLARILSKLPDRVYGQPVWSEQGSRLALTISLHPKAEQDHNPAQTVHFWHPGLDSTREIPRESLPQDWIIPPETPLTWDREGQRLSIGTRPMTEYLFYNPWPVTRPSGTMTTTTPYTELLAERSLDVWHWQDPQIKTQEKARLKQRAKQTYTALYTLKNNRLQQLGGPELSRISLTENGPFALGYDHRPYSRETTWDGVYEDVYLIDLRSGKRQLVLNRTQHPVSLSPRGNYLVYFKSGHWYIFDRRAQSHKNLTQSIPHAFADEDHDTPEEAPPYGLAGWMDREESLYFYDRFDIWRHDPATRTTACITSGQGRKTGISFRRQPTKTSEIHLPANGWLLTAYSHKEKWTHFFSGEPRVHIPTRLTDGAYTHRYLVLGQNPAIRLFTRENLETFPDIWVAAPTFQAPRQLTRTNPQIDHFNWGRAELMNWKSNDGVDLEGVVIKPEDYQPGKRYPVIVYYYELSADRLLTYNPTLINHRPCFPFYASNGYVLFLPDIRFQTGRPGQSATNCLIPGVLKLIDSGVADPRAIALHGHSWSGYQTAFVITQSDLFACALAGAPVANMTSAYSGIRWGEGMARQFQYEKSQSRIGRTLFEAPHLYIENSPVFFAERIKTPLLIEHGDEDEAVPWTQSIELYLALRRLQKPCVFLQYHREPHHLKQYANKLDYAIRMKEFFDHFLQGAPVPPWWNQAAPTDVKAPYEKIKPVPQ